MSKKSEKPQRLENLQPERSKREDLIKSEEYKKASPIQKQEFMLALRLREFLRLD